MGKTKRKGSKGRSTKGISTKGRITKRHGAKCGGANRGGGNTQVRVFEDGGMLFSDELIKRMTNEEFQ